MDSDPHTSSVKMRFQIIRKNESPDHDIVHTYFANQTIAFTSLYGEYFSADRLSALNYIVLFTTGHPSGTGLRIH